MVTSLVEGLEIEGIAAAAAMRDLWLHKNSFENSMVSNLEFDFSSL